MPQQLLGLDAELFINQAGLSGNKAGQANNWQKAVHVRDVTLPLEAAEADVSSRGTGGWRALLQTLKAATVDFDYMYRRNDAILQTLIQHFLANDYLGFAILDGDLNQVPASQGFWCDMMIFNVTKNEMLEEGQNMTFTCKLYIEDVLPYWGDENDTPVAVETE